VGEKEEHARIIGAPARRIWYRGWTKRYLRGQTRDQRFAVFGTRVAALFDKAATLAGA
jgi:hypothetical protein